MVGHVLYDGGVLVAFTDKVRGDITAAEKKAYIAAMLCVQKAPSKLDPKKFPGAKSRYDDFVVVHMNQTLNIHGTVCRCLLSSA